jgi:hypothetical protein
VVVLGLAVGLAEDAVIDRDLAVAVGPQQGDQVDAQDDVVVLAGPVAGNEVEVLGVLLVESSMTRTPLAFSTSGSASDQSVSGSGSIRCRSRVKESWAGAKADSGCTRAASVQLQVFCVATRNWM